MGCACVHTTPFVNRDGYCQSRKLYRDEKTQLSVRRKSKLAEYEAAVLGILKSASRESDVVKQLKDVLDRQNRLVEEVVVSLVQSGKGCAIMHVVSGSFPGYGILADP